MERMCSELHGAPATTFKSKAVPRPTLLQHLKSSVLCLTVDSAGDELLSAEMMRTPALNSSQQALTPGLRFVIRDSAHASRRVISRPWFADEYMKNVAFMFARGRSSIARIIQNSPAVRDIFKSFVLSSRTPVVQNAITNLRAAGHRFEPFARPMGRTCLHLHACIRTAVQLVTTRGSSDPIGSLAKTWLQWLSTEKCVMLSMMADAADQSLWLTRLLDAERTDPALLHKEVHNFNLANTALFTGRGCVNTFGYTSVMLDILKTQVVYVVGNSTYSIGCETGVPDYIINQCLDRMKAYVVLARATLAAEFPSFELAEVVGLRTISPRGSLLTFPPNAPRPLKAFLLRVSGDSGNRSTTGLECALIVETLRHSACSTFHRCRRALISAWTG